MRLVKIIYIPLLLIALIVSTSCTRLNNTKSASNSTPTISQQLSSVVKGTGELIASSDDKLAFKTGGQITRIFVKEGDAVKLGQMMARLDTSGLEVSLAQARLAQDQALLAQDQARVMLKQTELSQSQAQAALDQAKLVQIQANSALAAAQFNLDRTDAVKDIQDDISKLQRQIEVSKQLNSERIASHPVDAGSYYLSEINSAQLQLLQKQKKLIDLLTGSETGPVMAGVATYEIGGQEYDRLVVQDARTKELAVEAAQKAVDQSVEGIAIAQKNIDLTLDNVVVAQKNLKLTVNGIELAQTNVDYIQKQIKDSTLVAPFNGIIADLPVQEGDIIPQPTAGVKTILRIIDPASFEATANIDEEDIAKVKPGQLAVISLKALPDIQIKGKVTKISSVSVVKPSSEVDYKVTIQITDPIIPDFKVGMSTDVNISLN